VTHKFEGDNYFTPSATVPAKDSLDLVGVVDANDAVRPLRVSATGALLVDSGGGGGGGTQFAEDSPHVSGDLGTLALAVRNDGNNVLTSLGGDYSPIGVSNTGALYLASRIDAASPVRSEDEALANAHAGIVALAQRTDVPAVQTSATGDAGFLQQDANGALWVAGSQIEDAVAASGDRGIFVLAQRKDAAGTLVGTDGDYSGLQVDANGNLRVTGGGGGSQFAEDTPHVTGDLGTLALGIRNDANVAISGTDGDYTPLNVFSSGILKVGIVSSSPGFSSPAIGEDVALVSGNALVVVGGQRTDIPAIQTSLDGDAGFLQQDANGHLWVAGSQIEDAAHVTGDRGVAVLGVRNDNNAVLSSATGDYSPIAVSSSGSLFLSSRNDAASPIRNEDEALIAGGHALMVVGAQRMDTPAVQTSADGDAGFLQQNAKGALWITNIAEGGSTSALTNVANAVASGTALAANAARKQAIFFNDDTAATVLLKLNSGAASATSFSVKILPGQSYELPIMGNGVYTGAITCIATAATGTLRVTEIS
jgi:hypothetical protein